MKYIISSYATKVEQHRIKQYISGVGSSTQFSERDAGWFLYMEGSHEAVYLGDEMPEIRPGDKIEITIERVSDDK